MGITVTKPDEPSEHVLRQALEQFVNGGGMNTWASAENAVKWLAARYPDRAEFYAEYYEGMRVGQLCDIWHLPPNAMTRQERDSTKAYVDRCDILLDWFLKAGVEKPDEQYCSHGPQRPLPGR